MAHSGSQSSKSNVSNNRIYNKEAKTTYDEEFRQFTNEALFLSRVKHPHVVELLNCGLNDFGRPFLHLPKLLRYSDLPKAKLKSPESRGNFLASILNVLDFLSFLNLSHGDLKPEHFVFNPQGKCIVIDFAQVYSLSSSALIGTSAYLAPELFWKYPYSLQSDLFSLGIATIQMFYRSESTENKLLKYSSVLNPWSQDDLLLIKSELDKIDSISRILSEMISFSPLKRPKSGREIVEALHWESLTTCSLEKYDNMLEEALKSYIEMTHWFSGKVMIGSSSNGKVLKLRQCHEKCKRSFFNNFRILSSFTTIGSERSKSIKWITSGASICRLKYNKGVLPRKLPKSVALPSTIDLQLLLDENASNSFIKCEHDFRIPYVKKARKQGLEVIQSGNVGDTIERIEKLIEQRRYEKAGSLADENLKNDSLDNDSKLILLSFLAYSVCHTKNAVTAEAILKKIKNWELAQSSTEACCQYYLSFAWCLIVKGKMERAAMVLSLALKRIREKRTKPNHLLVKIYLRIAALKWLSKSVHSALYYNGKALRLSKTVNCSPELIISLLLNRSLYLGDSGRYDEEAKVHQEIRELLYEIELSPTIVNYLHNFGIFCLRTGKIHLGGLVLKRAYVFALSYADLKAELPHFLLALGNAFFSAGDVRNAKTSWSIAERQFNQQSGKYGAAKCMQNLAELANLVGEKSEALTYLNNAFPIYKEIGHDIGLIDIELIRAWCEAGENMEPTRLEYIIKESERLNYNWGIYQALNLKAALSAKNQDWNGFKESYLRLEELFQKSPSQFLGSDLHYMQKLIKLVQEMPEGITRKELWTNVPAFLATNRQLSYRRRSPQIAYLNYALEAKANPSDVFKRLRREAEIEGRIMMSDTHRGKTEKAQHPPSSYYGNHLKAIREIANVVDKSHDVEEYVQKVLDKTVETLQASRAAIFITSKYSDEIEVLGTSGCQKDEVTDIKSISRTLVRHALGGDSIFIRDVAREENLENLQSLVSKKIKSAICIPLKKDNDVIGIMYVDSIHLATHFEEFDKDFLDTLGSIISGGIFTSKRVQKLNDDYLYFLAKIGDEGLKSSQGLLLPSPQMQDIYKKIFKVSKTNFSVLFLGQSGSGKDVLARMIHENSSITDGRFIVINCSAIPEQNIESELFGVSESAFTGVSERPGKFELANGGTLFLDEIADMPLRLQSKLLRVIETKEVERLGGKETKKLSFRLISATNRNLTEMISSGNFREDLYHRINDIKIEVPKLSERPQDIKVLIQHFYQYYQNQMNVSHPPLGQDIINALMNFEWPGGIRELSKVIGRLVVMSKGTDMSVDDLPEEIRYEISNSRKSNRNVDSKIDKRFDKEHLNSQLRLNNFSIRKTARQLHIPESTLRYYLQKHKIQITPIRLRA